MERGLAFLVNEKLPCLIFEDDHLLVVSKPAGMNTHSPSSWAGEGLYEWLKNREPRWSNLAILHRLDKETSGLMVFGKTRLANQSLAEQFSNRQVHKEYLLLTDRNISFRKFTAESGLVRSGEKYLSRPVHAGAERAETRFIARPVGETVGEGFRLVSAEPITGKTHQIRVHAAAHGFPILGDKLYGGTEWPRLCLHSHELRFRHPVSKEEMTFSAPADFTADARQRLRESLLDGQLTNAYRILHGASDGWPGWHVDRLGDYLLSQSERPLTSAQQAHLAGLLGKFQGRGAYHKILNRHVRQAVPAGASPQLALGEAAPAPWAAIENGLRFELSFKEGYSVGLFLDQRENRRRFLTRWIGPAFPLIPSRESPPEVLNTFAYTCAFSVCAARAGARVTSLDLSKKYLEWGRRNFALNQLDPAGHEFVFGDVFDWLRRWHRKKRSFDVLVVDPPTFSQSKASGVFRVEKNYGELINAALGVLRPEGVLLASTNAAGWKPEDFLRSIHEAVGRCGREILREQYAPQPFDFPVSRDEPAYLKTAWFKIG